MINSNYQLNGKVFYRDNELSGTNLDGEWISPERMRVIFIRYEKLLRDGKKDLAGMIQEERGFPRTWLHLANYYFLRDTKYLKE